MTVTAFLKRLARDTLVHFLLIGALLFGAYSLVQRDRQDAPGLIVISQGQQSAMRENFARTRQRAPTAAEWEGLLQARVREEVFYQEALALELDVDDVVIRRRLQQKMEFISDGVSVPAAPSEAELAAFLQAHPDDFRAPATFSFRHVYFDPQKRGTEVPQAAQQLKLQLNSTGVATEWATLGDPLALARKFDAAPATEVARMFGDGFATDLAVLAPGSWHGPVQSAFGVHLVYVDARSPAALPPLASVRDQVRHAWAENERLQANERFYQALRNRYTVTIEPEARK